MQFKKKLIKIKIKNFINIIFFIFLFLIINSCSYITKTPIPISTQTKKNKILTTYHNSNTLAEINPFKYNPVKDNYNYPYVPSDFLTYEIYRSVLNNNNFNNLLIHNKNDNEIYNYLQLYEIIKEFSKDPVTILNSNTSKLLKLIELTKALENSFKKRNQFFKAKYFNLLSRSFLTLKKYISQQKYSINSSLKSQNLTAIVNVLYLTGEPLLVPVENYLINKALNYKKYDIAYFFGGKINLLQNNMLKAKLYFGLGLQNITKKENETIITTYYYQARETIFNYEFNINFTNKSRIENVSFKLFIPNTTEYQNLSNLRIYLDKKLIETYNIIKNEINQNILYIKIEKIAPGNHILKIFMNIHTIPYKFSPFQISKYHINDYDFSSNLINAALKPSQYFNYNEKKVKNYIKTIKDSLPQHLQNNILSLTKQAYLFVINKLSYDPEIMNNLNYKLMLDKKYGKDATRALLKPDKSVCENYATLLTTILRGLKIPTFYVYGPVYKLPYHAWVKILLPDKRFYILDPTFADPIGENGNESFLYFLFNPANRIEESILDPNYPLIEDNPESNITVSYEGDPINNFSYNTKLTINK